MTRLLWTLGAAAVGALGATARLEHALKSPPEWSLRTNVSGRQVPAVLGGAIVFGGIAATMLLLLDAVTALEVASGRVALAAVVVFVLLAAAGWWDDRRGDESPRGFGGHLRAGRLTGGVVKIAAGGLAGIAAGLLVYRDDLVMAALTALAVPLGANLFNLLDRAPGRTGKAALVVALPLLAFGDAGWAVAAAGAFGGLAAVLRADLQERAMLGDAGANPLGALIGLGLAVSLDPVPLAVAAALLLALNAASEVWSFSKVIDRSPLLRAFDSLGRDRRGGRQDGIGRK